MFAIIAIHGGVRLNNGIAHYFTLHVHACCREARRFDEVQWKDVRLGDFVEVLCDNQIPADILLLRSSDEGGVSYIETATLDGETNLKQRQAVLQTQQCTAEVRPS